MSLNCGPDPHHGGYKWMYGPTTQTIKPINWKEEPLLRFSNDSQYLILKKITRKLEGSYVCMVSTPTKWQDQLNTILLIEGMYHW